MDQRSDMAPFPDASLRAGLPPLWGLSFSFSQSLVAYHVTISFDDDVLCRISALGRVLDEPAADAVLRHRALEWIRSYRLRNGM